MHNLIHIHYWNKWRIDSALKVCISPCSVYIHSVDVGCTCHSFSVKMIRKLFLNRLKLSRAAVKYRERRLVFIDGHYRGGEITNICKRTTDCTAGVLCCCSLCQTSWDSHHPRPLNEYSEPGSWWVWQLGQRRAQFRRQVGRSVSNRSISDSRRYCRVQQQRVASVRL